MSKALRASAFVAFLAVSSVVWVVYRTVDRAYDSNQWVVHTQQVLTAIESVLSTLLDADRATRDDLASAGAQDSPAIEAAQRAIGNHLDDLAALTADTPDQQARVRKLRNDTAQTLAALRAQRDARREGRAVSPADAETARQSMEGARATMRALRTEENRLLVESVEADRAAVRRLQWVSLTLVALAAGLVTWVVWLLARDARRQRQGAELLRRANENLEAQVDVSAADLRASEARWRSIVESAVDGIIVIDAHGRVEAFNPAAERLFGHPESDVIGRNVNMLMPSPYHEEHDTYLARHLATGAQKVIGTGREVTGLRRDGTTFPLHLSVGKMAVDGVPKFTGILHDLSARVRIEEQMREQASLARIGEMAAVIAHEVKNPLAGVRGAVQVIGSRLPQDGRDAVMVKEIVSRIDSLNELMKDLLLFARPPKPKPAPIDVATLVATTADLLGSDPALKDVRVTVNGALPPVMADADLLKIVFANLLVNGAHAMHGRGTIRVSLSSVADVCRIAFADEGPGIPSDIQEKVFTPFFTTKARGSGLGLPTAKRLIEAHGGSISIVCPTAGGTVVTIELPGSGAAAAT